MEGEERRLHPCSITAVCHVGIAVDLMSIRTFLIFHNPSSSVMQIVVEADVKPVVIVGNMVGRASDSGADDHSFLSKTHSTPMQY